MCVCLCVRVGGCGGGVSSIDCFHKGVSFTLICYSKLFWGIFLMFAFGAAFLMFFSFFLQKIGLKNEQFKTTKVQTLANSKRPNIKFSHFLKFSAV